MSQKIKQIIIAVVIIVIAFIGFKYFFGDTSASNSTLTADTSSQQFVDGQAILTLLNRLNKVTLNEAIFSNPVFAGLVSFEVPIPDQVTGRTNPFAPIGSSGGFIAPKATSTVKIK
jgi:hypothetical protein